MNTEDLIEIYFQMGLQQAEILAFLNVKHNIFMSQSTLKRTLQRLNLHRRKNYSDINEVFTFIQNKIQTSNQLHGYRWMHLKCLQNGFTVTQRTVQTILKITDPIGVELRSKKRLRRRRYFGRGPNFIWHLDCYDKLKPYGICMNACIDGFSRYIVWLYCGINTNNPNIIANEYIRVVRKLSGIPRILRVDMGTENAIIAQMQTFLWANAANSYENSSLSPLIYGTSQANQRIESWWSILRKHLSQFWMNLFKKLKDDGYFSGTYIDKSLIQFCFLKIIQNELLDLVTEWNTHRIRYSKNLISPVGRPIIMYEMPYLYNTLNYLCEVEMNPIDVCNEEIQITDENLIDKDIVELCEIIMQEKSLSRNEDPYNAIDLYIELRKEILERLN